jgi:pyridinium-3,5-biscarboxylic acid mononucleotide sulfurtransferase
MDVMDRLNTKKALSEQCAAAAPLETAAAEPPPVGVTDGAAGLSTKEKKLRALIADAVDRARGARLLVAFSGGVDSSLLLWESVQAVGAGAVIAVTATSATSVPEEEQAARQFAALIPVQHLIVPTSECEDPAFLSNPPDRCYICKLLRYRSLKDLAAQFGPGIVLDGTQADDDPSDRPGMRALAELTIRSPLREAGIGKAEVRALLRQAGFVDLAEKNAQPCLATRIPTGDPISAGALETVRNGEALLRAKGLQMVRLRHHGSWARIVTDSAGMAAILGQDGLRESIDAGLKELGFLHVTLDLAAYGSA